MYVDESGDPGNNTAQSDYFCLSGIVVHESEWRNFVDSISAFRRTVKDVYGLPVRAELHAVKLLRHSDFDIQKHQRLAILRNFLDELAKLSFISVTNVVVNKSGKSEKYDIFASAWAALFQRFENTLVNKNFPGSYSKSSGLVFTDATNGGKLTKIVRKMSAYNPVPNSFGEGCRDLKLVRIIEDPSERDSRHSLPVQACDTVAYFLHQYLRPNSYIRKSHAQKYFERLDPVLNKNASRSNKFGIVML